MRKKQNNHGFTLIEMLIVVAIIAILVAVSIPIVGQSLERARESTDMANERAAKAAVMVAYLSGEPGTTIYDNIVNGTAVYYDAANGKIVATKEEVKTMYGKNTTTDGGTGYKDTDTGKDAHKDLIIQVTFKPTDETVKIEWVSKS